MTLSPSTKSTVKRFAWLWGAVLGVAFFSVLTTVCYYLGRHLTPTPTQTGPSSVPLEFFWLELLSAMREHGVWSAGLGYCGALLWTGNRSLKWRLLSLGVGIGVISYQVWSYWTFWKSFVTGDGWDIWLRYVRAVTLLPLLLGALVLIFFALLMRSSHAAISKA